MQAKVIRREGEALAGRGVGTPGWLQRSMFIVDRAVAFAAEEFVLEAVLICDVGMGAGSELGELVGGEGCGAE